MRSPESVLKARGCEAKTVNVSDQHATILLTSNNNEEDSQRLSLLKLTAIPFHREVFQLIKGETESQSDSILSFLSNYDFQLTSESGAEYSYHDALPKRSWFHSFLPKWLRPLLSSVPMTMGGFKVELISPASERQVQRAMPRPQALLIQETPELYETVTKPYIESVIEGGSLSWIANVVEGKKERERLLLDTPDFILNVDTKWRSHPDANAVPRSEWHGHESVADLYCLAIAKDGAIKSMRDLRAKHLPMLRSIVKDGTATITKIYGIPANQLRVFVHYQPQFYHFHAHFTRLENEIGCQVERGHLLTDLIQNLEMEGDFYSKRTISYKLPNNDRLYSHIKKAQEEEKD